MLLRFLTPLFKNISTLFFNCCCLSAVQLITIIIVDHLIYVHNTAQEVESERTIHKSISIVEKKVKDCFGE